MVKAVRVFIVVSVIVLVVIVVVVGVFVVVVFVYVFVVVVVLTSCPHVEVFLSTFVVWLSTEEVVLGVAGAGLLIVMIFDTKDFRSF